MKATLTDSEGIAHRPAGLVARYLAMAGLLIVFVGPFLWMLRIALETGGNIYSMQLFPQRPGLANLKEAWTAGSMGRAFANSMIVAALQVGSNLLLCSLAAYPLARFRFPGRQALFLLILATMMIPFQVYLIPLYLVCRTLGLEDSLAGVILPGSAGALGVYLLRQQYLTIPQSLEEAARVDGASELRIWYDIMVPLTRPALAALAVFVFVQSWSSFLWPLVVLQSDRHYTLPITVAKLAGSFAGKTQTVAAASVMAVAPVVAVFCFVQRFFLGGLTLGSVKG